MYILSNLDFKHNVTQSVFMMHKTARKLVSRNSQ